jgi:hypothetical protein
LSNLPGSTVSSMYAWEAALCSGAAPIYFPPFRPETAALGYCADGGLYANNPSLAAIVSALAHGASLGDIYLLSLDTGTTYDSMPAAVIDRDWGGPLHMGPLAWLSPRARTTGTDVTPKPPLLSALMDASASEIAFNAQSLLGLNYMRITVPLTGSVPLDDFSTAAYATMDASLTSFYSSRRTSRPAEAVRVQRRWRSLSSSRCPARRWIFAGATSVGTPRAPAISARARTGHAVQFSMCRPATRPNSRSLFDTRTSFLATACAAIRVSSGPIGVPDRSSFARTPAYATASSDVNSTMSMGRRKFSMSRHVFVRASLLAAPVRSSASVITLIATSDRLCESKWLSTTRCCLSA